MPRRGQKRRSPSEQTAATSKPRRVVASLGRAAASPTMPISPSTRPTSTATRGYLAWVVAGTVLLLAGGLSLTRRHAPASMTARPAAEATVADPTERRLLQSSAYEWKVARGLTAGSAAFISR